MAKQVCMGATLKCTFGAAPSKLVVLPTNKVLTSYMPAATIMDHKPLLNILPFGPCSCPSFPATASATAAAMGVLTPMPCVPATTTPWMPGVATVLIGYIPALDNNCTLMCMWGGLISVSEPGQTTHDIP